IRPLVEAHLPLWADHKAATPRQTAYGPDHAHYYHRHHGNHNPVPLDLVAPNAEAALPLLKTLPKARGPLISAVEHLLAAENANFQKSSDTYRRLIENRTPLNHPGSGNDQEIARSESLASGYQQLSASLGRLILLTGM